MEKDLLNIYWTDAKGEKHLWITVGTYHDPKHPNRKFCYHEQNPQTYWFDDAKNLQDVMAYLWENVISTDAILEKGITITVEKA